MFFHEEFKKLIDRKIDFEFIRTSYTKKLKTAHSSIIFNNDGTGDDMALSLINKVRNDAKKFLKENEERIKLKEKIYFLDMFAIPDEEEIIMKVDLTSAYWKLAVLEGIVTKETNEYFNETFKDRTGKELKSVRLKALGSLATRKEVETFKNGVSIDWDIETQETKKLYMYICAQIDKLMRECKHECNGCIFYYWDCMFVRQQYAKEVIDFFMSKQFECKSEETKLSYDEVGTHAFFTSEVDGKMYVVKKEDKFLLSKLTDEQIQNRANHEKDYA